MGKDWPLLNIKAIHDWQWASITTGFCSQTRNVKAKFQVF
jgi:hypothetical protein